MLPSVGRSRAMHLCPPLDNYSSGSGLWAAMGIESMHLCMTWVIHAQVDQKATGSVKQDGPRPPYFSAHHGGEDLNHPYQKQRSMVSTGSCTPSSQEPLDAMCFMARRPSVPPEVGNPVPMSLIGCSGPCLRTFPRQGNPVPMSHRGGSEIPLPETEVPGSRVAGRGSAPP